MRKQVVSFVVGMARQFPASIAVMFLVAGVWAIDLSLNPYFLKLLINRSSECAAHDMWSALFQPAVAVVALSLVVATSFRLYGYLVDIYMIPHMRQKIAVSALQLLLKQSHHYYQNNFSGSLVNKVNDLIMSVPDIIQIVIDRFFANALALAVAVFALWQVSALFALSLFVWVALFIVVSVGCSTYLVTLSDRWSELGAQVTGKMGDVLSNILSVRLFARQQDEGRVLGAASLEVSRAEQGLQWAYFWVWCFYAYSFCMMQAFNLYFLIKGRANGTVSAGDFALVLTINITVASFLWTLTKELSQFSKLWGRITQALRTLIAPVEIQDIPGATKLTVKRGDIVFDAVQFQYKGAHALFHNKSVRIDSGQKVGLVGHSGGGKSTFVNLILRLFEVSSGRIMIDGQDIREVTQHSLHSNIGMIPQDPSLFHRTLMDNIRYGRIEASDEEVMEAAKKAHAHDFIMAMSGGYNTMVGERGIKISGGQRQRIAIARAILKNAPILILDEATSQLDSITENQIQDSLSHLMHNKTTLVIAHRLSTLLHMDRILVFDQGKIVEDGSHHDLLGKGGMYKTLWEAQIGGFLLDEEE